MRPSKGISSRARTALRGAVAADQPAGADALGRSAAGGAHERVDGVGAAVEGLERQPSADLDARPLRERAEQRPLQRRLVDGDERWMAVAARARAEHLDGAPGGGDDARAWLDLRVGEDGGVEPCGLQDPQHLVVDDGRARQRVGLGVAVDGQRRHALVAEQQGEQLADRPEAADDHVVVGHGYTGTAVGSMRLVSVPMPSISSSTVWPGWIQRSCSSPQQPGIVPVEMTSPASSFSPAEA